MTVFDVLDEARRWQGNVLDLLGGRPIETPSRIVLAEPAMTLKSYGEPDRRRPTVLIVPAPIKRPYIWDLAPSVSAVQQFLRCGFNVYLVQWERVSAASNGGGLNAYADALLARALHAITAELGTEAVTIAGHSLGGTFAAIFAALHPEAVRALVLLGTPLQFGKDAGAFAPLVASSPPARHLTSILGKAPGSFLNAVSITASPTSFVGALWADRVLSMSNLDALHTHVRVERWTLDEQPMARELYEDVVELLYRENRFMRGTLRIAGKTAAPQQIRAPLMTVIDPRSRVVPPQSALPFHEIAGTSEKRVLQYRGDIGVGLQHVGMLVGRNAHRVLWPDILEWLPAQVATPGDRQ